MSGSMQWAMFEAAILKFEAGWQSRCAAVTDTLQQNHRRGEFHAKVVKFDTSATFFRIYYAATGGSGSD